MKFFLSAFLVVCLAVFGLPSLGNATPLIYQAFLDGPSEAPPNASPGTGFARVTIDTVAETMLVEANFSNLDGLTTAAHIHGPTAVPGTGTAAVMTQTPSFLLFPLGVTSGSFSQLLDLTDASTYRAGFITASNGLDQAEAIFLQSLADGTAYFNIHTTVVPGGEIRGFLTPLPASLLLLGTGLAGLAGLRLKRKQC